MTAAPATRTGVDPLNRPHAPFVLKIYKLMRNRQKCQKKNLINNTHTAHGRPLRDTRTSLGRPAHRCAQSQRQTGRPGARETTAPVKPLPAR